MNVRAKKQERITVSGEGFRLFANLLHQVCKLCKTKPHPRLSRVPVAKPAQSDPARA